MSDQPCPLYVDLAAACLAERASDGARAGWLGLLWLPCLTLCAWLAGWAAEFLPLLLVRALINDG